MNEEQNMTLTKKNFLQANQTFFEQRFSVRYWVKLYIWPFGLINQAKSISQTLDAYLPDDCKIKSTLEECEAQYFYKSLIRSMIALLMFQIFIGLNPCIIFGFFLGYFISLGLIIRNNIKMAKVEYLIACLACLDKNDR